MTKLVAVLREVEERVGVSKAEQIRRGIRLWLEAKSVMPTTKRLRVAPRKRPLIVPPLSPEPRRPRPVSGHLQLGIAFRRFCLPRPTGQERIFTGPPVSSAGERRHIRHRIVRV